MESMRKGCCCSSPRTKIIPSGSDISKGPLNSSQTVSTYGSNSTATAVEPDVAESAVMSQQGRHFFSSLVNQTDSGGSEEQCVSGKMQRLLHTVHMMTGRSPMCFRGGRLDTDQSFFGNEGLTEPLAFLRHEGRTLQV